MTMNKMIMIALAAIAVAVASCGGTAERDYVPAPPDYADTASWYRADRGGEVDVFYIVSTEIADYDAPGHGAKCHVADVARDSIRALMLQEMRWVDAHYTPEGVNFYSPYYRQISLNSWQSDSCVEARFPVAMADINAAFDHYLQRVNDGRPFVLMGFSQGAKGVVELLKRIDADVAERLVAAYVIGYKVTEADLATGAFHPAAGPDDLGVTVCYNSVRDTGCAVEQISGGNLLCINPVNWRTDAAEAALEDTLTVACDPASHLLIVSGFKAPPESYVLPLIGREGNYHHMDLLWYAPYIKQNIARRALQYLSRPRATKRAA